MFIGGDFPLLPVPLCDAVICVSPLMAVLSDLRMAPGWAVLSCCGPSRLRQEESSGPGPCGEPAAVLVCLAVSDPGRFGGSLEWVRFLSSLWK